MSTTKDLGEACQAEIKHLKAVIQLIQPRPMPTKYLYFSKSLLPLDKKAEAKAVDDALSFLENTS